MADTYPKAFLEQEHRRVRRGSCFVLMPFDERFDEVYAVILCTLQSPTLNIVCRRADDVRAPNILETILGQIQQSEYVLADLTASNANVFYELGIAHCVKDADKVVILVQDLSFVPFDLRHLRCILYGQTPTGLEALRQELLRTFESASRHTFRFRVHEGRRFVFAKKLAGRDGNLFELEIECAHVGLDAVKLIIHFREHAIDRIPEPVKSQFLFLGQDKTSERVNHIPWNLHLVQSEAHEAIVALEMA